MGLAKGPVYYDEFMERTYVVYYDVEKADSMFVVCDRYGDPMFRFPRMSRAQKKDMEASLRHELELVRQHYEKPHSEAEAEGKRGLEMHHAIKDQARADGLPDYDLDQALEDLEKAQSPVDRVSDFLFTYGLVSWFGVLCVGATLRLTGVIAPRPGWGGIYIAGGLAIAGAGWLVSKIPERWG